MQKKNKLTQGNVILTKAGNLEIVYNAIDERTDTISLEYSNMSFHHRVEDYEINEKCDCGYRDDSSEIMIYDEECKKCQGQGHYKITIYGSNSAKVIANTVKEFIIKI